MKLPAAHAKASNGALQRGGQGLGPATSTGLDLPGFCVVAALPQRLPSPGDPLGARDAIRTAPGVEA